MISLEKYGMTTAECVKAFNAFGVRAADIIKRNPYALCGEESASASGEPSSSRISSPTRPITGIAYRRAFCMS